jgi:hypothetical protein
LNDIILLGLSHKWIINEKSLVICKKDNNLNMSSIIEKENDIEEEYTSINEITRIKKTKNKQLLLIKKLMWKRLIILTTKNRYRKKIM